MRDEGFFEALFWSGIKCPCRQVTGQLRADPDPQARAVFTGFDDKIIALYARGMTVQGIQAFLLEQYGTQVSPEFISSVTDDVMAEVTSHRLAVQAAGGHGPGGVLRCPAGQNP